VVAHALTGNLYFSARPAGAGYAVHARTLNGNVDLLIPAQANANLELSTVAGNIVGIIPGK